MRMMRNAVLLIGGDLCRHVANRLDADHWQIWGLRRHPPADNAIHWIEGDLAVPASLRDLPRDISHVLYAPSPDARDRASYQTVYPLGVAHILDALGKASRLQRFVWVGSTVAWPASGALDAMAWVDESSPTLAHNFRAEAILQAEATLFARLPGRAVALRLGGIYGPGRIRLIEGLRSGRIVAPTGPGHWSNRIHIDDAASACIHLLNMESPAEYYIGTDGNPVDTRVFYRSLAELMQMPYPASRRMPPSGKRLSNARLVASGWTPAWPDALTAYQAILATL